ncbi:hypothetical protein [Streptomyces sp. NBC_01462]|uniref:hypothetical protein n=1 Tax=Streptomyces sp. NBC_01462 TaxID=2903876 RepID=UPI002E31D69A|nr:hypothetical protein [Streptomyces sp. NBC_01462]
MTRTLLNIDAAACSHHDGDTKHACRRTVVALTALSADYSTGWSAAGPWTCTQRSHRTSPRHAVRELRDGLAA